MAVVGAFELQVYPAFVEAPYAHEAIAASVGRMTGVPVEDIETRFVVLDDGTARRLTGLVRVEYTIDPSNNKKALSAEELISTFHTKSVRYMGRIINRNIAVLATRYNDTAAASQFEVTVLSIDPPRVVTRTVTTTGTTNTNTTTTTTTSTVVFEFISPERQSMASFGLMAAMFIFFGCLGVCVVWFFRKRQAQVVAIVAPLGRAFDAIIPAEGECDETDEDEEAGKDSGKDNRILPGLIYTDFYIEPDDSDEEVGKAQ